MLRTVGRGILDDHMACGGKVPEAWLDERLSGHVLMAFDLWGEPGPGNPSSARDLVGRVIPRLWIHQLEVSDAQFLKEYLTGGRATSRRYLDVWFRRPELARGCQTILEMRCGSWCCVGKYYPNLDWPEVCKCPSCDECGKETLEHFLFSCRSYGEERLALFRRIRERLALGEEYDVEPLIRMVLGLENVVTHEAEDPRVVESVKGDTLPLPDNPSYSVKEGTVPSRSVGPAREDRMESGRVSTPGGVPEREEVVLSLSHPPPFSRKATGVVSSSSQVGGKKVFRQSTIEEFWKIADKGKNKNKDKDKDISADKTLNKTGPRTRSTSETAGKETAIGPSNRSQLQSLSRGTRSWSHGSPRKDKTVSGDRTLEPTGSWKSSNPMVAQGTERTTRQLPSHGQESRTTGGISPLTARLDTEPKTSLPTEGHLPLAGRTLDKDDDCTDTATSTDWTTEASDADKRTSRFAVDKRFHPIVLCGGSVDLRGSLRGFGDCRIAPRRSLGRKVMGRIYCTSWSDIVLDKGRRGASCTSDEEGQDPDSNLGPMDLGRKNRDSTSVLDCDGSFDFGEKGELAGCEELAKFLQATHYKRRTYYGIWKKKTIASRLAKWAAGQKSKAARNGRDGRSANRSRSPAGQ